MKETKEVKVLRGKLLGMELELSILSKDLERFKLELAYNKQTLNSIEKNISFLKNEAQIVSLCEFKKIMAHRKLISIRVKYYQSKVAPLQKILDRKEVSHKEELKKFEHMYRMQFKNNILEFPANGRKKA